MKSNNLIRYCRICFEVLKESHSAWLKYALSDEARASCALKTTLAGTPFFGFSDGIPLSVVIVNSRGPKAANKLLFGIRKK